MVGQYTHERDDRDTSDFAKDASPSYVSPWLFHVEMSNLKPCKEIKYQVGLLKRGSDEGELFM